MKAGWRVYYSDGSIFDRTDSEKPPTEDAQIIVQHDPNRGWITTHGSDFYVWKGDRWWGCEIYGLFRFLKDTGLVLFGETIPHNEFDKIYQQAKAYKLEMVKEQ